MKILLLSDTHNYLDEAVLSLCQQCDEIWHAGDIGTIEVADTLSSIRPLVAVYGNIDGGEVRKVYKEDYWFEREGLHIWMTHIGGYPPKYNRRTKNIFDSRVPDIFVCGHSHILKVIKDKTRGNMLCLNPGAVGKQGFHSKRTMLRFELANKEIKKLEVIDLGKK